MSYIKEFPDYDGELYIPKGFNDYSWHNDVCPHVEKRYDNENLEIDVCIWQDYIDISLREREIGKRYLFQIKVNDGVLFSCETDDLEKVKELVKCFENGEWIHDMK